MMKICIIGLPKSGTSALYQSIRNAMPSGTSTVFEPKSPRELAHVLRPVGGFSLCKVMFSKMTSIGLDLACFDRTVAIVRDPRDLIISMFMYRFDRSGIVQDAKRFESVLERLREKEQAPHAVDMVDLLNGFGRYEHLRFFHALSSMLEGYSEFLRTHAQQVTIVRYESYFGGSVEALSRDLGLRLDSNVRLSGWVEKIHRKGQPGDWRHWFTAADIEFFRPALRPWMREWGYDYDDWQLANPPSILPEHCSEYVGKLVNAARTDPLRGEAKLASFEILESAARDGKPLAMFKLANRLLDQGRRDDVCAAMEWYERAALMGHVESAFRLAKYRYAAGQIAEAQQWFLRAYEEGHAAACFYLWEIGKGAKMTGGGAPAALSYLKVGAERGSISCEKILRRIQLGHANG